MGLLQAATVISRQSVQRLFRPGADRISWSCTCFPGAFWCNARRFGVETVNKSLDSRGDENTGPVPGLSLGGRPHVAVGMSGGVDSSVAALLLQRQGYKVTGLYMRNWDPQDEQGTHVCTAEQDYKDASAVCDQLGIDLLLVDYHRQYWSHVFEPLTKDYALGLTPNPDLHCNKHIKFDALLKYALHIGAEKLATGHYARVQMSKQGKVQLLRAVDKDKDQSYFLASVSGDALRHVIFPIGTYVKAEVRKIAGSAGLAVACKRSSAGICFVGRRHFPDFISEYIEMAPGEFISVSDGSAVGTHAGAAVYTHGQRARISGAAEAWFVVGKEMQSNKVFVAQGQSHAALFCRTAVADSLFWVSGETPQLLAAGKSMKCMYKARYSQDVEHCTLSFSTALSEDLRDFQPSSFCVRHNMPNEIGTSGSGLLQIRFDKPAKAITPGQALVLYDGDICLGGGLISYPGPSVYEEMQSTCSAHADEAADS